jgi:hypothetical protein
MKERGREKQKRKGRGERREERNEEEEAKQIEGERREYEERKRGKERYIILRDRETLLQCNTYIDLDPSFRTTWSPGS